MRTLGLFLDPPYISFAIMEKKGKKTQILSLKAGLPATPEIVKQLYIDASAQSTSTAIPALFRTLHFKISSPKQIFQILPFQVESLTCLNPQEIAYTADHEFTKTGTESTIFITSKKAIQQSLEEWQTYSFTPDRVGSTFSSLIQFCKEMAPDLKTAFLIDLGSKAMTCLWMEEGKIKKGFTIEQGVESILAALWEDQKKVLFQKEVENVASQMDLLQMKPEPYPHLVKQLDNAKNSIVQVLTSFQTIGGIQPIFFTGRIDAFIHFREYLLSQNQKTAVSEFCLYEPSLSLGEQKCAMAIGCALEQKIQFLKGEFTPTRVWQKAGKWGTFLLSASFLFTILACFLGYTKLHRHQEKVGKNFKSLIEQADPKFANTFFLNNLEEGIEQAALAIQKYDKETPYILQAPTVSEVLAWISSHPLIEALKNTSEPIEIVGLKYQLVSFPHIEAMREPYRAKLDLEFSVTSPMNARKFHEALLQDEEMVNTNDELTWESSESSYHTSFFLKNRTSHV